MEDPVENAKITAGFKAAPKVNPREEQTKEYVLARGKLLKGVPQQMGKVKEQ